MYHVFLVDGPLGGETFGLATEKRLPERLYLAPMPDGMPGVIAERWIVVGTDRDPPASPFPEQAAYELDVNASIVQATRGIVIYGHAEA